MHAHLVFHSYRVKIYIPKSHNKTTHSSGFRQRKKERKTRMCVRVPKTSSRSTLREWIMLAQLILSRTNSSGSLRDAQPACRTFSSLRMGARNGKKSKRGGRRFIAYFRKHAFSAHTLQWEKQMWKRERKQGSGDKIGLSQNEPCNNTKRTRMLPDIYCVD